MKLFLCEGCNRHVRDSDAACPFCGEGHGVLVGDSAIRMPRMSRGMMVTGAVIGAAVSLALVNCGSESAYGGCPTCSPDAAVDAPTGN
jgi:hypothetical protein